MYNVYAYISSLLLYTQTKKQLVNYVSFIYFKSIQIQWQQHPCSSNK